MSSNLHAAFSHISSVGGLLATQTCVNNMLIVERHRQQEHELIGRSHFIIERVNDVLCNNH